jgi:hypothetical protein
MPNEISTAADPHALHREKQWRWWSVLSAHNQNVTADLEFVRLELARLNASVRDDADIKILQECERTFLKCLKSHDRFVFKNRIFVRQSILVILENAIMITPPENLRAVWLSVRQRLKALDNPNNLDIDAHVVESIDAYFNMAVQKPNGAQLAKVDQTEIRAMLREIRTKLDDRLILDYWSGIALQQKTYVLFSIAALSLVLTLATLAYENSCFSTGLLACGLGVAKQHSMIAMTLAGILGGSLSTISQPVPSDMAGSLPLVRVAFIRPLLGGIAGLFLYLLNSHSAFITAGYPYLYAAAIAFGFSERAFAGALMNSATEVSKQVGQAIGQRPSEAPMAKSGKKR